MIMTNDVGLIYNLIDLTHFSSNQNFFSRQMTAYLKETDKRVVRNCNRTEMMIKS